MKSFKSFLMSKGDSGISKEKETQFHAKLDKLVHNTFGKRKNEDVMKEDGMGAGAVSSSGPTNVVSSGAIAGSGGLGGEPGVRLPRKKKQEESDPRMMSMGHRNPPKM